MLIELPMIGQLGIKRCPILDNFGKKGRGLAVLALAPTAVPSRESDGWQKMCKLASWKSSMNLIVRIVGNQSRCYWI